MPLIHTFRTPYGHYFYETNRNQIFSTTYALYQALQKLEKTDDVNSQLTGSPLSALREMGYLSARRTQTIQHPYSELLENILTRSIGKITLQLTQDCNLRCRYCAYTSEDTSKQRTHKRIAMTWDIAKKAIDFLYDHSSDSKSVTIGFYGGEPLLEFDLLRRVVDYADTKFRGKKCKYSMTTNGTILHDQVIEYFIEHNIDVLISIDGPKEVHDANRVFSKTGKGSFNVIMNNLERIKHTYPSFLQTLNTYIVVDPRCDLDCYNQLFIDSSVLMKKRNDSTYINADMSDFQIMESEDFVQKNAYGMFLAYLYHLRLIEDEVVPPISLAIYRNIFEKHWLLEPIDGLPATMAPGGPCVPGATRMLVDVHGNFFPCEKCSEVSAAMKIGSLSEGIDIEKANALLNIAKMNEDACKDCWAILHCSCCAAQITDGDTLSAEKMKKRCVDIKEQIELSFYSVILLRELNNLKKVIEEAGA